MNTDLFQTTVTREADGSLVVTVTTEGLDRRDVYGWSVGRDQRLADRLVAAVQAGKALTANGVKRDVAGRSYLSTTAHVMGRYMNADLKRLGF